MALIIPRPTTFAVMVVVGGSVVKSSQEHDRALVWRASGHVHCQISGLYLINREGSAAPSYR
ncbi:hypothetical protein RRF59_27580 (plasmid) [Citrobacter freundii]|uniref:hypothetical protein n=1 Tax=Citrobacter freundii TaxID=546 RepID=UPI002B2DB6A1|nr:hypothetical protein RRF59_27580 [Citrobacter freundii]